MMPTTSMVSVLVRCPVFLMTSSSSPSCQTTSCYSAPAPTTAVNVIDALVLPA